MINVMPNMSYIYKARNLYKSINKITGKFMYTYLRSDTIFISLSAAADRGVILSSLRAIFSMSIIRTGMYNLVSVSDAESSRGSKRRVK